LSLTEFGKAAGWLFFTNQFAKELTGFR
jgi:hypothetical protein